MSALSMSICRAEEAIRSLGESESYSYTCSHFPELLSCIILNRLPSSQVIVLELYPSCLAGVE